MTPANKLETEFADETQIADPELLLEQLLGDPRLQQQMTRTIDDQTETVVAYHRCRFEKGQQRVTVHLQFSPPLENPPDFQGMVVDDQPAVVRLTDRHTFGLRAEVVLPREAEQETSILIEMIATSSYSHGN